MAEQQVEGFRRGDENVGRTPDHLRALGLRRIARADSRSDPVGPLDALQGLDQVSLDVVAEGLQRRDVEDVDGVGEVARAIFTHEVIDGTEERGEGLPRPGGREQERVVPAANDGPGLDLGGRGPLEGALEPRADRREEAPERIAGGFFARVRLFRSISVAGSGDIWGSARHGPPPSRCWTALHPDTKRI